MRLAAAEGAEERVGVKKGYSLRYPNFRPALKKFQILFYCLKTWTKWGSSVQKIIDRFLLCHTSKSHQN
jgi:hypothetical protein